jgi:hypothetical protein
MGAMSAVPPERLVRLLNLLEKNIRDGAKISLLGILSQSSLIESHFHNMRLSKLQGIRMKMKRRANCGRNCLLSVYSEL